MFTYLMNHHDFIMFLLRVVVGIIFIYHGLPKFKKPEGMAQSLGWNKNLVKLLGALEILSGVGVILGILIEWSALFMAVVMIGAMYHKIFKWKTPFWAPDKSGWEGDLLILVCALLIMAHGGAEYVLM